VLPLADPRAAHVARVLQLRDGDTMRVGVLNGGADDEGEVRWLWPSGSAGRWARSESRQLRPERLTTQELQQALESEESLPEALELSFEEGASELPPPPRVDLLLAPPPQDRLKRLLPQLAQLGVGTIILCNAKGVDSRTLGMKWLSDPEVLGELLVQGLVQSGDTAVPRVVLARRLRRFLEEGELDELLPRGGRCLRLFVSAQGQRMFELASEPSAATAAEPDSEPPRVLLAVGPDGGWQEPGEAELFTNAGFKPLSLGPRGLSVEAAACAALALASGASRRWAAAGGH